MKKDPKVNYKTAVALGFHRAGAELSVWGSITMLDQKARVVVKAIKDICPGVSCNHFDTWEHVFDCDRRTDCCHIILRGDTKAIRAALDRLQAGA